MHVPSFLHVIDKFIYANPSLTAGVVSSFVTLIVLIVTFYWTFLKIGRIVFLRPPRITFLNITIENQKRDAIIVPIALRNTGTSSKDAIVSLAVRKRSGIQFLSGRPHAVLTNDFELEEVSYSQLIKGANKNPPMKAEEVLDLEY